MQTGAVAGVPEEVEFATKPELATKMITEALDAGIPARWASGDEVYGANPALASLEPVRLEPGWEGGTPPSKVSLVGGAVALMSRRSGSSQTTPMSSAR